MQLPSFSTPVIPLLIGLAATVAHGQQTARVVKYHANDIVSVRAKMRYTTLIQLPSTEKILEVATGDKDFWIIDTVGNYCFLHPAKEGIHSNLNLITDGHLAPHDLRRTCARLCHSAGGELEQIQFLLGHASVQTTERYIGCRQKFKDAVNDRFKISLGNTPR
jgi:hypothetical protein